MTITIQQISQSLEAGDRVELFEIDLTPLGLPGEHLYFSDNQKEGGEVVWRGNTYVPIDMETSGWEWNGQGALPTPKLKVSNATDQFTSLVDQYDDLVGAEVTRWRTWRVFLDGEPDADPDAHYGVDIFVVDSKTAQNGVYIEWALAAASDQQGKLLPGRQVLRDTCMQRYRIFRADPFLDFTVDPATDRATAPLHGQETGDGPYQLVTDGVLPGGLALATDYWLIVSDPNTFQFASNAANALAGTAIDLTSAGTGTHSFAAGFDYGAATCPYTGTEYFKADNSPTADASADTCSKLLSGCRLRFGQHGRLPTWAFPGCGKVRV